ncbi:MAG: membrane dipeptidase [Polyangiaceae bacterium]
MPKLLNRVWPLALVFTTRSPLAAQPPTYPVVDLHVDLSYQYNFKAKEFADAGGQFSAAAVTRGGVEGVVLPLFVPRRASSTGPSVEDLEHSFLGVSNALRRSSLFLQPGCFTEGHGIRTFLAFEGAGQLADNPASLARWATRGLRIVGLVHTEANELASSSGDPEPKPFGLTERGRAFVLRAFELGLIVDVSHASDRAVTDILAVAKESHGVVVATHSNARALANHPRNLTDDQLRGIAATGGVVGVNFHGPFLARGRAARLSDIVTQVRHLTQVAGIEHVAIGSDFEGDIRPPVDLADASRFPRLSTALAKAGFDDLAIRRIFAGNALRVLCPDAPARTQ